MKTFTYEEAVSESISYFDGDELAATTWINKYALRNQDGELLESSPKMMHDRLINELLKIENKYSKPLLTKEILKELLYNFKYVIPGGSIMSGLGNNYKYTSLSNCFVVESPVDSYGGIFLAEQELIQILKRRGGVGLDMSKLRPDGTKVSNDAKTSSGLASFMERYSNGTRECSQNGRRGALMLTCSIDHPDAEKFIDAKLDTTKITGANISIKITNEFLDCIKNKKPFYQVFPVGVVTKETLINKCCSKYNITDLKEDKLYSLDGGAYIRKINPNRLWMKLMNNAWKSAEPGILLWDKIIDESPADFYDEFRTIGTNPCLTGDTLVELSDGAYRCIKDIKVGDKVMSYNTTTKEKEPKSVLWSGKTRTNAEVISLNLKYGSLKCTPDHKLWDPELEEYIEANKIEQYLRDDLCWETVRGVEKIDNQDVYDITVEDNHNFFTDLCLVHNCSELPLCAYDSCRLTAINLYSYVDNPFTDKAVLNKEKLSEHTKYAQRIMDNIIDAELEHIQKILTKIESDPETDEIKTVELNVWKKIFNKTKRGRRTGLGITAEGDMLAALGIKYDSDKAKDICEEVHKIIAINSYESSIDLAVERGAFECFDNVEIEFDNIYKNSKFVERIYNELPLEYQEKWYNTGRRNIANLTIAPTGTISLMTQTTSGIEPLFKAWYTRRRKTSDKSKAVFIDKTGDMFEEFKVFHPKFIEWYKLTQRTGLIDLSNDTVIKVLSKLTENELNKLYESSPWYLATAQDINWVAKVELQGRVQKWIDHSISATTNIPNDTSVDTVSKIYMTAAECGCKGMTIYRDGSRDGVLVTKSTEVTSTGFPNKRPKELPAKIVRFKNGSDSWIAFIGLYDGKPFEIFCGMVDEDLRILPKSINEGKIIQVDTGEPDESGRVPHRYDFQYQIPYGYINTMPGISAVFDSSFWNYSRMISGMFRAGIPIDQVVNILEGLKSDMGDNINSWKRGVIRALRQFIKNGVKAKEVCPECGETLVYESGCKHCIKCGWSKCD